MKIILKMDKNKKKKNKYLNIGKDIKEDLKMIFKMAMVLKKI